MAKAKKAKRALSPYNRHVQREMKAGRSMKQAAASWKSGSKRKSTRRISVPRRVSRPRAAARPRSTGGRKKMAGFNTQKIFKYLRLAALLGPAAGCAVRPVSNEEKIRDILVRYTGYDMRNNTFNGGALVQGWGPYVASVAVTYGIPKLAGIIRGL